MDGEHNSVRSLFYQLSSCEFDQQTGLWHLWHPTLTGNLLQDVAAGEHYALELVELAKRLKMPHLFYQARLDACKKRGCPKATGSDQACWFSCGFYCKLGELLIGGG